MRKLSNLTRKQPGFTLAEMAIVVVLAGIMLTMGLKMATANLTNAAYSTTVTKQALIKTALINYLRSNGFLPCPDTSVGAPIGTPSACTANSGVLPWKTLQISKDAVTDGWGNFFTYQVANGTNSTKNWTVKTNAATTFDVGQLAAPSIALTVNQGDGVAALTLLTNKAVVVLVSAGMNGAGAKTVQGQKNANPTAADEITNATPATAVFVMRPVTTKLGATGGPFDDIVTFMSAQDLLQPLVSEQFISSCRSYCQPCTASATPWPSCLGANNPAIPPAACNVALPATIPVGNPQPSNCP